MAGTCCTTIAGSVEKDTSGTIYENFNSVALQIGTG